MKLIKLVVASILFVATSFTVTPNANADAYYSFEAAFGYACGTATADNGATCIIWCNPDGSWERVSC